MKPRQPPLWKRLTAAHWVALDCGLTLLVGPLVAIATRTSAGPGGAKQAAIAVVLLSLLAAGFRRCWRRTVLAPVVLLGALATGISASPAPWLAVAFVMYLVPLRFPRREALWLLTGTLLATLAASDGLLHLPYHRPISGDHRTLLESVLVITVGWTLGYAVRQQRLYATGQREQAEREARERLDRARRALGEERLRIARELHDVVAHSMSVIAVQAGVANHVAAERPEEARRALSSIEQTSRDAMRELRALLGVLRDEGPAAPGPEAAAPAPGLTNLAALAERSAEAGVQVEVSVSGERPELSAGVDLAAYRVVQEAVTNVIKHAAADRCQVAVDYQPDGVSLQVEDPGNARPPSRGSADGHGLIGMRERVGMYGGEFHAGPLPGRGFRVTARFPLTNRAAR